MIDQLSDKFIDLVNQNKDNLQNYSQIDEFITKVMPNLERQLLQQKPPRPEFQGMYEPQMSAYEPPKFKTMNFNAFHGQDLKVNSRQFLSQNSQSFSKTAFAVKDKFSQPNPFNVNNMSRSLPEEDPFNIRQGHQRRFYEHHEGSKPYYPGQNLNQLYSR